MRVVIKIGTSTITHNTGRLNIKKIEHLCKVISDLKNSGNEIILVSSGAIGMGVGKLGLKARPDDIASKQAAAAVGQCELMYVYDKLFSEFNHNVAQILVTGPDLAADERRHNFENTLYKLLEFDALPIINENDTISTDEIEIGDNDTLSAIIASGIKADLLVLLSDIDGLYDKNPKKYSDAKLIPIVEKITTQIKELADGKGDLGTGGMATKISAAITATSAGVDMIIANGSDADLLYDIIDGKQVGTKFVKMEQ